MWDIFWGIFSNDQNVKTTYQTENQNPKCRAYNLSSDTHILPCFLSSSSQPVMYFHAPLSCTSATESINGHLTLNSWFKQTEMTHGHLPIQISWWIIQSTRCCRYLTGKLSRLETNIWLDFTSALHTSTDYSLLLYCVWQLHSSLNGWVFDWYASNPACVLYCMYVRVSVCQRMCFKSYHVATVNLSLPLSVTLLPLSRSLSLSVRASVWVSASWHKGELSLVDTQYLGLHCIVGYRMFMLIFLCEIWFNSSGMKLL